MRLFGKLAALAALAVTGIVLSGAGESGADPGALAVHVLAQSPSYLTLGWTPPANAQGYVFLRDGVRASNTWNGQLSEARFWKPDSGRHTYEVEAVTDAVSGVVTNPAAPTTTTSQPTTTAQPPPPTTTAPVPSSEVKGYYDQGANQPAEWSSYKQYGFNLVFADINTTFLKQLASAGAKAWVQPNIWTGCGYEYSQAQALTWAQQALATGAVAGFYVADEPSTSGCSSAPAQIAAWTQALHAIAPSVPTIIAVYDSGDLAQFAHSADAFALDTYPCQYGNGCNYSWITSLAAAADKLGLAYYGVPQAFGGDGHYDLPTAAQETNIIDTWRATNEKGYVIYAFSAIGMPSGSWLQNHSELLAAINAENAK